MILVTGTKRSGTSMWMQALVAGGIDYLGSQFSAKWEESIGEANPHGFFESKLRSGIFYATNPDPKDGKWLHPKAVEKHVVKVFIPGVVRTDYAYITRVIGTMRDWRLYGPSLRKLQAMEDDWILTQENGEKRVEHVRKMRSKLPPPIEWWFEYYDLLRDVAIRRYPVNLATYDQMLRDPEAMLTKVFDWIGHGDAKKAIDAIDLKLKRTTPEEEIPDGLERSHIEVFDQLYHDIDSGTPLTPEFLGKINEVQAELSERFGRLSRERQREDRPEDGDDSEAVDNHS